MDGDRRRKRDSVLTNRKLDSGGAHKLAHLSSSSRAPRVETSAMPSTKKLPDAHDPAVTAIRRAAAPAPQLLPLRNRNIGVLCSDLQRADAVLLQQAATGLGARVALVRSELDETSGQGELQHTARVLGRLYDAVLCVDMPPSIVQQLRDAAGIPVISDEAGQWRALPATESTGVEQARVLLLAQLAGL